jgi:hypothetical protein
MSAGRQDHEGGPRFDGTKLDETKWDVPEYKRRDGHWSRDVVEKQP